jgi:hypothetical protein
MSLSSKNDLQELLQRQGLPLPKYETTFSGGPPHSPMWKSRVTLHDGRTFEGADAPTKTHAEKNAAHAALPHYNTIALSLNKKETQQHSQSNLPRDVLHGSDRRLSTKHSSPVETENLHAIPDKASPSGSASQKSSAAGVLVVKARRSPTKMDGLGAMLIDLENAPTFLDKVTVPENITIYGFISEHSARANYDIPQGGIKVMSPSLAKDAADTMMQVYTGTLLLKEKYDFYYVVTRDHFGPVLVELISSAGFGWSPKPARLISDPTQFQSDF